MRNYKQELENLQREFEQYKRESVKWSVEDFIGSAVDLGYELTREQAQEALEDMIASHDPTIGITWDTVYFWTGYYGRLHNY